MERIRGRSPNAKSQQGERRRSRRSKTLRWTHGARQATGRGVRKGRVGEGALGVLEFSYRFRAGQLLPLQETWGATLPNGLCGDEPPCGGEGPSGDEGPCAALQWTDGHKTLGEHNFAASDSAPSGAGGGGRKRGQPRGSWAAGLGASLAGPGRQATGGKSASRGERPRGGHKAEREARAWGMLEGEGGPREKLEEFAPEALA